MSKDFYTRHKEGLLKIASICLVILFFAFVELLVRFIFPANAVDPMIDLGPINLFSKQEINGETWYGITNKNAYSDRNVQFKEKKDADHVRIICLGGSASAGWPHPPDEIYSEYLRKNLQNVYPHKKIEVINCSAHGFASYRIRQVFETIIPFEPDAVIIWCGNNEFLEGRNYRTSELKNALLKFRNNFRTLQLVRQQFVKPRYDDTPDVAETFWRKVNREALELRSNPEQFSKVKEHFESSIDGILQKAHKEDIKVVVMTVPVNLRDWEPNVSVLGVNNADSLEWLAHYKDGKREFLRGNHTAASNSFGRARAIAPLHAETAFLLGKTANALRDTTNALRHFMEARDLDYNPFRALSEFNEALRKLAGKNPGVALLDMENIINGYAESGIPGFDLFLDYVHPTRDGNLVIAKEIANKITAENILGIGPISKRLGLQEARDLNASPYRDEDDLVMQFTRFSLCCMTHQYYAALHFGKILKERIPAESYQNDPSGRMTILSDAIKVFQAYADMEQKGATDNIPAEEEKKVMDDIKAFYTKHFPYGVF